MVPIESISAQSFFGLPKVRDHLKNLAEAIDLGHGMDDMMLPLGLLIGGWALARGFASSESMPVTRPPSVHNSWPAHASIHCPRPVHLSPPTSDYITATSSPASQSEASYNSGRLSVSKLTKVAFSMLIVHNRHRSFTGDTSTCQVAGRNPPPATRLVRWSH